MPRIYVACLASYNAGKMHGRWIDLDGASYDEVQADIAEMLRNSPCPNVTVECPECGDLRADMDVRYESARALGGILERPPAPSCSTCGGCGEVASAEEWAVHDSEGLPGGDWGEHPNLEKLIDRLEELEELGDDERDAYDAFCAVEGQDASIDTFRERFIGEFDGWAEMAEQFVEDSCLLDGVPDTVARYFDYERYGREMQIGGDAYENNGYYFWNH